MIMIIMRFQFYDYDYDYDSIIVCLIYLPMVIFCAFCVDEFFNNI